MLKQLLNRLIGLGKRSFPYIANLIRDRKIKKTSAYFNCNLERSIGIITEMSKNPYPEKLLYSAQNSVPGNYSTKHINIEVNNTCNLDCLMCRTSLSKRTKGIMDVQHLSKIVSKVAVSGFSIIELHTIGEPLMYPNLRELLDIFRQYNLRIGLTTNGLLIDKHINLLNEYTDVCSSISFSIDAATRDKYEKIRVGGNWEKLIINLELAKRELKGYHLNIKMTISADNLNEVGRFVERFRRYVRHPHFDLTFGFINGLSPDNSYFKEMNLFRSHIYRNTPCAMIFYPMGHILIDGKVSVCCRDYNGEMIVGDANEESFEDIFHSSQYQELRASHLAKNLDKYHLCNNCYTIDERIGIAFRSVMEYVLYNYPGKSADFYQDIVDKFIKIINCENICEEYRKFILHLNAPDKVGNNGKK